MKIHKNKLFDNDCRLSVHFKKTNGSYRLNPVLWLAKFPTYMAMLEKTVKITI